MKKLKIKKGDTVQVITGSDKGKSGSVLGLDSDAMKIQVAGVRIQIRHNKKEKTQYKEEGWIDYSNVKLAAAATKAKKKTKKKAATAKA